jgi:ATP-binding cassette subfamily B protein
MHPPSPKREGSKGWRERFAALRHFPPLLAMLWQTSPPLAAATAILRVVAAVLPVGIIWVAKLIIDRAVAALSGTPVNTDEVWLLLGIEAALAITADAASRAIHLCDSLLGDKFTNSISLRLMEHAGKLDLTSFEDPVFYDKLERARRQTTGRLGMLAAGGIVFQQVVSLLSLSVGIFVFSPWFVPLLLAAVIPAFLGETHFTVLTYSMLYRNTPERRQLDYLRMLGASAASAKEVKIFGLSGHFLERSRALFDRFYSENRALAIRRAAVGTALNLLPALGYYAAYAIVLHRTLTGAFSVGDLTFLTAAIARSRGVIDRIFTELTYAAEQALFLEDLFDFFKTNPAITSRPGALPAPRPIRDGYQFEGVSFAYPGSAKLVLDRVSLEFNAGERIALIGENGAGKTTLVKLLARLYDPTSGRILLDGVDLRDYDVEDLRKQVGVIFQDYMRYDMSVLENIGLGRVEALGDAARIEQSAKKAAADILIERLPDRYEQMLGRRFDGGMDLSAGQWQKIALARAYMRDAQVLILDEPTASLDARSEYEVFLSFSELTRDRMAVLISHRFSTVRMADRILVLESGRIIEQGSHQQLLTHAGRYAELFEMQAAGYR